eukprot:11993800-Ditylum_brightwellii.AAC.2
MNEGTFIDAVHNSTYKGKLVGDKKDGYGNEAWSDARSSIPEKDQGLEYYRDPCMGWLYKRSHEKKRKYFGHYRKGMFHGEGKFTALDGRFYEGQWENGKPHGWGRSILLPNQGIGVSGSLYRGFYYEGQWVNGTREGQGRLWFLDGISKEGEFRAGHPYRGITTRYPSRNIRENHKQFHPSMFGAEKLHNRHVS